MYFHLVSFLNARRRLVSIGIALGTLSLTAVTLAAIVSGTSTTNISAHVTITQLTINKPTVSAGDLMVASIAVLDGSIVNVTAPSGWTQIARTDNDVNVSLISYWKVASASEASTYTWSFDEQTKAVGGITPYSGVDTANPIDAAAGNTGYGTVATTTAITTTGANEEVIALFATDVSKTFSTPTGMTEKYDLAHASAGPQTAADDALQATAGTAASKSSTITGNKARNWASQQIALRLASPTSSIAFDNATIYNYVPAGAFVNTFSHTVSGNNRVLFVAIENFDTPYSDIVSTVTYNGTPLTRVSYTAPGTQNEWLYVLFNPTLGTHDVVITLTLSKSVNALAVSYTGATNTGSDVAGLDDVQTNTNNANTITATTTPVHSGDWAITMQGNDQADPLAGTNINAVRGYTDGTFLPAVGDSNGAITGGVAYPMTWNNSGAVNGSNGMTVVSLVPAP